MTTSIPAARWRIAAVIPAHPARNASGMTRMAVASVLAQTLPAAELHVPVDLDRAGAWATRQRGLASVDPGRTPWVAFLDSDDAWMPHHLQVLADAAEQSAADYVYSYYLVRDAAGREYPGVDPLGHFGKVFDPAQPLQTTITTLVRTELAQAVGFHAPPDGAEVGGQRFGEDYQFTLGCVDAGARIVHVPQRTWWWTHHQENTSGLAERQGVGPRG